MLGLSVARTQVWSAVLAAGALFGCSASDTCGPATGVVRRAIDGDTVELSSGERVRYLLVDTPEITNGKNACFGAEALAFNRELVEGRAVALQYGPSCSDRYGRLLAYVRVDGLDVNAELIAAGYACVLHIPPSGDDRVAEFRALERDAQANDAGLWRACAIAPCG